MLLIIDCGYKYIHALTELVDQYMDFEVVSLLDTDPETISNYDGIIISSAQITVNAAPIDQYLEKLSFIKTANLPILGIGVGHHLLGALYEGFPSYQPYSNDFVGISILKDHKIFDKLPYEIEMLVDHAGTISIPPNFELLASSDASINEAMSHTEKPIVGIQFLPEKSGNHGSIIIENFVNLANEYKRNK